MPRRFEFTDGTSSKFWEIELAGSSFTVRFGKIGTAGQTQTKSFATHEKATKEYERLVAEKVGKGYIEQGATTPTPVRKSKKKSERLEPSLPVANPDGPTGLEPALPQVVQDLYLVSDKITPVAAAEIDKLEKAIGSLPYGYRDLMLRCGSEGQFLDTMKIFPPDVMLAANDRDSHPWDSLQDYRMPEGFSESDIAEHWYFGGDGCGGRWIYCPRFVGEMFEVHVDLDLISRCRSGFVVLEKLLRQGKCKFDFAFFEPRGKSRLHESFELGTKRSADAVSKWAEAYWRQFEGEVRRSRLPRPDYGNCVCVFVRRIGGIVRFNRDEKNNPGLVYGSVGYDNPFAAEVDRFLRALSDWIG